MTGRDRETPARSSAAREQSTDDRAAADHPGTASRTGEMEIWGKRVRCHPGIIVEKTLPFAPILFILIITLVGRPAAAAALAVLFIAVVFINYRIWSRTTIQFDDTGVVVERDTVFKRKKTIPYSKVASVNINRGITNRLLGTSSLLININSGSGATVPEAVLTFEQDTAESIRSRILHRLYTHSEDQDEGDEPVEMPALFSPLDVILHGLFSVSTYQTVSGLFFLVYSVFQFYVSAGTDGGSAGAVVSLLIFAALLVGPIISQIFYYYNYRVYRRGDTIYLQHGLIRSYRTSFDVSRINAVRVKSTLAARLMHRSCIEAEVVGLASGKGQSLRPVLCLLKDDATQQTLLRELVPEFVYDRKPEKQPEGAARVLLIEAGAASLALALVMIYPSIYLYRRAMTATGIAGLTMPYMLPVITVSLILAIFYAVYVLYRITDLDLGENLFSFVNGAVDRETVTMNYDRVQMVVTAKGPIARLFDVARSNIYLLSSIGGSSITSGYFHERDLNAIGEIVVERIASGDYDYRKNSL